MLCGSLDGRGVWGRMDICVCVARTLAVHLKLTALLIGYSPILSGFPGGARAKELACQCRRHKRYGFDPSVGKIPWRRVWKPTLLFLSGEAPLTEEPGVLQSIVSHRVRQDWIDLASMHAHTIQNKKLKQNIWRVSSGEQLLLIPVIMEGWGIATLIKLAKIKYIFTSVPYFLCMRKLDYSMQKPYW